MKAICAALASVVFAACATAPIAPAVDRGPMPTREQAERAVKSLLLPRLKDPDSLKQFQMAEPIPTAWRTGILYGSVPMEGWLLCFRYNAKNSYGAYAGMTQDAWVFRNTGPELEFVSLGDLTARGGATCPP